MARYCLWFCLLFCGTLVARAQQEPMLIRAGDVWQYFKAATAPAGEPLAWTLPGYAAGPDWLTGRSGIGAYVAGRELENVSLLDKNYNYLAVCFRRDFVVTDPESVQWLTLRIDYQEGFVAYLNGVEVARVGLAGKVGDPVAVDALAATRGSTKPVEFLLGRSARSLLKAGTNTLAIQVHTDRIGPGFPVSLVTGDLLCLAELLANFNRGPFVQNVATNAATVLWKTPLASEGVVEIGTVAGVWDHSFSTGVPGVQHEVRLSDLEPEHAYFYRVRSRMEETSFVSPTFTFRTLKTSGDVHFCVLGDTGSGTEPQYRIADQIRERQPDLVLHCGDTMYASLDPFRVDTRLISVYAPHMRSTPYYFTMGNHDKYYDQGLTYITAFQLPTNSVSADLHQFERTTPELYYSFDHGDVHFVSLYIPMLQYYDFAPGTAQYAWLERDLAESRKPWKILFQHMPVHTSGPHFWDDSNFNGINDAVELQALLLPLAQKYGVNVIFAGHDHMYERFAPDRGVQCITSGAGGVVPLYGLTTLDPLSAKQFSVYHFTEVQIHGDTMRVSAIGTNNLVLDEFVVQRAPPPVRPHAVPWARIDFPDKGAPDGDGNKLGQRWPFDAASGDPLQSNHGNFASLGRLHLACDNTNLFVGLERVMLPPGADAMLFFGTDPGGGIEGGVTNLIGLGDGLLETTGDGVDGLDSVENLEFRGFAPRVACIVGDEYADRTDRGFLRAGATVAAGQGVFRLAPGFPTVMGARVEQFNLSPQNYPFPGEANADMVVLSIPLAELGSPTPRSNVRVGVIAVRGIQDTNAPVQSIDSGFIGSALMGSGTNRVTLEGIPVTLPADADSDDDWILDATEVLLGTDPGKKDTDDDGLPDLWELQQGMNPGVGEGLDGGRGDLDGDGLSNLDEYRLGLDPRSAQSRLTLQARRSEGGGVMIEWPGLMHSRCVVESALEPAGAYERVGEILPEGGSLGRFGVPLEAGARYFRIRLERAAP